MKYRKKPVVIEAIQYTGNNGVEIFNFVHGHTSVGIDKSISFRTLEGWEHASVGDYIIKGVHGEFYPCKPDIFNETYEKAE
jgi:hypothetical protein